MIGAMAMISRKIHRPVSRAKPAPVTSGRTDRHHMLPCSLFSGSRSIGGSRWSGSPGSARRNWRGSTAAPPSGSPSTATSSSCTVTTASTELPACTIAGVIEGDRLGDLVALDERPVRAAGVADEDRALLGDLDRAMACRHQRIGDAHPLRIAADDQPLPRGDALPAAGVGTGDHDDVGAGGRGERSRAQAPALDDVAVLQAELADGRRRRQRATVDPERLGAEPGGLDLLLQLGRRRAVLGGDEHVVQGAARLAHLQPIRTHGRSSTVSSSTPSAVDEHVAGEEQRRRARCRPPSTEPSRTRIVPLVEPRSRHSSASPSVHSSAWRRDTSGESIGDVGDGGRSTSAADDVRGHPRGERSTVVAMQAIADGRVATATGSTTSPASERHRAARRARRPATWTPQPPPSTWLAIFSSLSVKLSSMACRR